MSQKIFGITGWKNSGKTTLTERLVRCLTARGHRISTIKHAHHAFDIDHEGTDSWRHRKAGAAEVAIVSSHRFAIMHENLDDGEPSLSQIVAKLGPCDLVLVEGYKREPHKKIEIRRNGGHEGPHLSKTDPGIVAVVSDMPQNDESLPVFDINAIDEIADFIEQEMAI
ncbi:MULTISPECIES: molybdopterin-guanine dinucleotide biosynthesis protein B [Brucella]|uniref:Molybdopterin-guanine dinucleotide biosynthesis protein B n=9 Tax=Brucella TaxID=234 RepID=A0AAI8E9K4_BRUSS|nr:MULTISPECIES: molybdopterin-guanine dinucleotide biosynthesis protein B [Brucella]KEX97732.1 molybdopterin-guanine dinucleotide biosynthesis protein MobB [Brucella inopinata BO1]CUW44414.1 molybdopterin-guanine dinucleotide biosynthesis protein B [Brucella vulpis]AAN29881.1 molybdopterin-guanine dinucleotide biosynthesis protein B [Brucella suis 1330]ABQ61565.1 molybdopterin-guanine dinucleotide biosynthesis protein B [Brucella ovis ATCC 25840]ABY38058.1 molybdopterin-guanine dinucleotide b